MSISANPMPVPVTGRERVELMEELSRLYSAERAGRIPWLRRFRLLQKRFAWWAIIGGAYALKRTIDVFVSLAMLIMLSPLLLVVAFFVKVTDWGPVLFWQARVGKSRIQAARVYRRRSPPTIGMLTTCPRRRRTAFTAQF